MGRKVRKQINIDAQHDAVLRDEARRLGVSESEVVRRALEAWIAEDADARRARAMAEHERILAQIDSRRAAEGPGKPYKFRREDAYEERMKRYDDR